MRYLAVPAAILILVVSSLAQDAAFPRRTSLNGTWDFRPLARTTLKADGSIAEDKTNLPAAGKMPVPSN